MELGVVAQLTDLDIGIVDLAQAVEQAGLESLLLNEHIHVPASRRDLLDDPFHARDSHILDPFTTLAAAAAVTTQLKLGTAACVISQRDPIVLAKQVATLDQLSGGRFLFGVAAGWLTEELANHGVASKQRWDIMREHLRAMKQIWTHEEAEFHGDHVDFDPIWMWPKPVQIPNPPILVGGGGPRSLGIAADEGDGWLPVVVDSNEFQKQYADMKQACERAGRPHLQVTACLFEPDERLISQCAELGIIRCAILATCQNAAGLKSFLDRCSRLRSQLS